MLACLVDWSPDQFDLILACLLLRQLRVMQMHFSRSQGPRVCLTSSHDLEVHLKCLSQGLDVQKPSVHAQTVRNLRKSKLVNCGWFYGFDGWKWFERAYSCPNRPHISCKTPSWKNLKPDQKFPKIETGPVIETCQKWKVLILKPNPTIKTIKSITVDQVWLFRVSDWLCMDWWPLSLQSLT